ncbi:lipopolysaccharide biosynthesis protein [Aquirufa antheringensis]
MLKKISRNVIKETFWITLGQIVVIIFSILLMRMLTFLLSPNEYGNLALILTINGLFVQTVFASVTPGTSRFFNISKESKEQSLFYSGLGFIMGRIFILVISLLIILYFVLDVLQMQKLLLVTELAVVFAIISGFNSIINSISQADRKHNEIAISQSLESIFKLIIAYILVRYLGGISLSAIIAFIIAGIISLTFNIYNFSNRGFKFKFLRGNINAYSVKIWNFSWPFVLWGVFTTLQLYSDRWALNYFSTTSNVGLYSLVYQFGFTLMSIGGGIFTSLLTPIIYQKAGNGEDFEKKKQVSSLTNKILISGLFVSFVTFMISILSHQFLFKVFVDSRYYGVSYLFPWMVLSGSLFSVGQTCSIKLMAELKIFVLLPIKISTSILGIVLNVLGAKYYQIEGVVGANLIFSIVFLMAILIFSKRKDFNSSY